MSFSATSPFWLSDQASNVATLYNGAGAPVALVVSTPPVPGPTGQVFAGGLGFVISPGVTANFIFSTLAGTIDAWNVGTSAITEFTATDGAVYTCLAQAGSLLYAADTANGKIDIFDTSFQKTPSSVRTAICWQHISDPHLNSPWGVTLAPAGFGQFANDLLVGSFGDGMINAFDPGTGAFIGTPSNANGSPIVNSGFGPSTSAVRDPVLIRIRCSSPLELTMRSMACSSAPRVELASVRD